MENIPTMLFVVAAALTNESGAILLQKRPDGKAMAGLWEFPGGKVEQGESPENALVRELKEELGVSISHSNLVPLTFASQSIGDRHLLLLLYVCHEWTGTPEPLESPELSWVGVDAMADMPMPPADAPFIPALRNYLLSC